ncbi:MAG: two-component sensor histidine kinase, partial [Polyangiaceae bacterium]
MRRHRHEWHERGLHRVGRYIGARLHRRLFLTFGFTILFSAGLVFSLMHALGGEQSWHRELERARTFIGDRFEDVWDDPVRRDKLAQSMATDLDVDLKMLDPSGKELGAAGRIPCEQSKLSVPIERGGQLLGSV